MNPKRKASISRRSRIKMKLQFVSKIRGLRHFGGLEYCGILLQKKQRSVKIYSLEEPLEALSNPKPPNHEPEAPSSEPASVEA